MFYLLGLLTAGILQGVMVSLNAQLGDHFSGFGISFIVHGVALVLLLGYLLVTKTPIRLRGAPWYVYLVGLFGIFFVASSSWCTMHIGAAALMAISTVGQLLSSKLIDQFGLFGTPVVKVRASQIPGYLLLALGVVLVVM